MRQEALSFGAQPSFLPTGLFYPICETFFYGPASQFFVFLLSFVLFSLFGPRTIRYYSSTRTTVAVQTSNSLESEEYSLFAVRSIHTLCRLHGPFGADVYMYFPRKNLHVQPFLFFVVVCFLPTYEISTA